jgi:ferredoxin
MITIRIEESKCLQNHACPVIDICPAEAVSQKDTRSMPVINDMKCAGCGICTVICGYGAIIKD